MSMKSKILKIATAQTTVRKEISENGENIRRLIQTASDSGADLVLFCEGALSGYCKSEIHDFQEFDWRTLDKELKEIQLLCRKTGIWAVIGSCHRISHTERPRNSLYIVDSQGDIHDRYDKRFCSHSEIEDWYSAGLRPVVFEINEVRIGCATCIEVQFPEIFLEYEKLDVDCVLFSSYSDSPMFGIQAQGHAACNNYWISMSVPTNKSMKLPSNFIGPNGEVLKRCSSENDSLVINEVNPSDERWEVPVKLARPWRRTARRGNIYA